METTDKVVAAAHAWAAYELEDALIKEGQYDLPGAVLAAVEALIADLRA